MKSLRLTILACAIAAGGCGPQRGVFAVVNKSKEPIARFEVTVCGETIVVRGVQVGARTTRRFRIDCEGRYSVKAEFPSGKSIRAETGVVMPGMDIETEFTVDPTTIAVTNSTFR